MIIKIAKKDPNKLPKRSKNWKDLLGIILCVNSKTIDKKIKKIIILLKFLSLMCPIKLTMDKKKKANAWLIEVPIGLGIISGCFPKSP